MKERATQTRMAEARRQKSASTQPAPVARASVPLILELQRAIGNRAVQNFVQHLIIDPGTHGLGMSAFIHQQIWSGPQQSAVETEEATSTAREPVAKSKPAPDYIETPAPKPSRRSESFPSVDKATPKERAAGEAAAVEKEIPRAPATPGKDPAFAKAKTQVRIEAKKQKTHDKPFIKRKEAEDASAMTKPEQEEQSAKDQNTYEMERVGAKQLEVARKFSAQTFKDQLKDQIKGKGPKTEDEARKFAKNPPIEHFEKPFSENIAQKQSKVTGPLNEKADPDPKGGVAEKEEKGIPDPVYPPAPKPIDPKLVVPKAKTDQEISLQHESDRIDGTMEKNRLSDEQLAESREPSFLGTLKLKREAQQKIAEASSVYRQKESEILQGAEPQAKGSLATELQGMSKTHQKIGGHIFGGQQQTETVTEKRQHEIKKDIDEFYKGTVIDVKDILEGMVKKVKDDFANSLKDQTELFNKNVTSRLDSYYSFGKKAKHFLLGEPKVVVDEKTGATRSLTREDYLSTFPPRIKPEVKWINPEVYNIFLKEKDKFIQAMDSEIDIIARNVEVGLTAASARIQLGKTAIALYKASLKGDEKRFADGLEVEVQLKFANLESSIDDAREDLLQTLADQYTENVNQLEKTFNEINDELKKSWVDRAIEFIETVGKTIYQLAELLTSILVRMAHLVWDIIKHPIRFFETLVSGLKQGIGEFVGNIGTYMQEAFWTWITGATPVKNIRLSASSGVRALFDLVMQVLSLGPNDLRAIVEKVLGKEFMEMVDKGVAFVEKALEPVTILLTKGPVAFWDYLVDSLESVIQSAFDRIKESVFYAFVEKGLKWIAGFFIPGGGFVKIVKAIVAAFQFVAANLDKIRQFFDSVFDSMEDAVAGNPSGVATKIVKGLTSGVVLALDFLARQLGLEKLVDSVQKILQSIRRPIVNAIEWVLGKVKPFVMKLMMKGEELWAKGKEKVIGAAEKVTGVVAGWLGIKKRFKVREREYHTLYFNSSRQLMMASNGPVVFSNFVNSITIPAQKQTRLNPILAAIVGQLRQLDVVIANVAIPEDQKQNQLQAILEVIGPEIAELIRETSGALLRSEAPQYGGLHGGFGSSMRVRIVEGVAVTRGSQPSVTGGHWDNLRKRKTSMGTADTFFIRAHLLNDNLGGPGNDWHNLSVLSQQANNRDWYGSGSHETAVESRLKGPLSQAGKGFIYVVTVNYGRSRNTALINAINSLINHKSNPSAIPAPVLPSNLAYVNSYSIAQLNDLRDILTAEEFVPTGFVCTIREIDPSTGEEVSHSDHNINRTIQNEIHGDYFV
jgi:hypothetical protein